MKTQMITVLALLLSLTACNKETSQFSYTVRYNTSADIGIAMGNVGQALCSQNAVTLKVSGKIGINYTSKTFSTDTRDVSNLYLPCSSFLVTAYELIASPTGGSPTLGQQISVGFDDNCEIKVKPGVYRSIRIQGRTNWIGTDPAALGFPIDENAALKALDIDC